MPQIYVRQARPAPATKSSWPDATNTGVTPGTALTAWGASNTLGTSLNNSTISGKIFTGAVDVDQNVTGLTFDNCQFNGPVAANSLTISENATNITIRRCEFIGQGALLQGQYFGVYLVDLAGSVLVDRCRIRGYGSGILMSDGQLTVQDSYIHDPGGYNFGAHCDMVIWLGTSADNTNAYCRLYHNTITNFRSQTDAVIFSPQFGPIYNIIIHDNLLLSNCDDSIIHCTGDAANPGYPLRTSIRNNHLGGTSPVPLNFTNWDAITDPSNTVAGNTFDGNAIYATLTI